MKCCLLIPIYDHREAIAGVVESLEAAALPCLIVDDGSGLATQQELARVAARHPFVELLRRERNGGKGAALKTGYRAALERGFTHVVQIDADGQHDAADVPRFVAAIEARPEALVLGVPIFDASAPRRRLYARQLSRGLVWLACLSRAVPDPLCGLRGIPLAATVDLLSRVSTGDWMDFEPELAVRLVWEGLAVEPIATRVIYREGNLSHFSLALDYPRLAWLYTRLIVQMPWQILARRNRTATDRDQRAGQPCSGESGER